MKMTFQPKKRQRSKVHGFRKEWALQTEEKFWRAEEQKEEIDYQLRSQRCDLSFSINKEENHEELSFIKK